MKIFPKNSLYPVDIPLMNHNHVFQHAFLKYSYPYHLTIKLFITIKNLERLKANQGQSLNSDYYLCISLSHTFFPSVKNTALGGSS